jgi:hypothetical protein
LETNLKPGLSVFLIYILNLFLVILFDFIFYIVVAAIATVVTVAEILKNNGLAVEKSEIPCFL